MTLLQEIHNQFINGIRRQASVLCSQWTENYVVLGKPIPGPASFYRHPWSKHIHDIQTSWIGQKAAQMGFTQVALDRAIYTVDIRKIGVLYILPKRNPDAADFSRSKFDTMLELSPHIEAIFSNVRNMGHKQAGSVDLFIRGAKSRSGLKSISIGLKVFDEYDEMPQANVALADERSSGFEESDTQDIKISTPTVPGFGISAAMEKEANEHHYFFKCPCCGRRTELVYPECLVITAETLSDSRGIRNSYIQCKECKSRLLHEDKPIFLSHTRASWESVRNSDSDLPGFQIPQLYSTVLQPHKIASAVLKAREDPSYEQELWNSKMGLPFKEAGASLSDDDFTRHYGNYSIKDAPPAGQLITMGVDVGHRELYVEIDQWLIPPDYGKPINEFATSRLLHTEIVKDFEDLDRLMYDYQVVHAVVDVDPDRRGALRFALRHKGHVSLCRFVSGVEKNQILPQSFEETVFVNRTSWLDISLGRFRRPRGILLPNDLSEVYKNHLKDLVRMIRKDRAGELKPSYISLKGVDHFGMAHLYADVALPLAFSNRTSVSLNNIL